MPPAAGPGTVPAGGQPSSAHPRLLLDQDPMSQVPPHHLPPHRMGLQELGAFFLQLSKENPPGTSWLPGTCRRLSPSNTAWPWTTPLFSPRLSGVSCENSQVSWGDSYPGRGRAVQRPGHNSVHLCSLPHDDPEQAPSLPVTLFSPPLPLYVGRSWDQALPLSMFTSNIPDSPGSVLLPLTTSIENQTLSR